MKKSFVVLKLENVYAAPKAEYTKGFYANFKLIFVIPEKDEIKNYDFKISGESYEMLNYIEELISGNKIVCKDEIIQKIQNDINENVSEFPIEITKSGQQYHWYLLEKMIEISEKV